MGLCAPSEFSELQAAGSPPHPRGCGWAAPAPPMRSCAPSASPRTEQQQTWPGLPHPVACALRFSRPLGAFVRPVPGGLVSCRIRSWGSTLQSFAPPAQPCAVSSAVALLALNGSWGHLDAGRTEVPPARNANHRTGAGTAPKRSTRRPRAGGSPHRRNNGASRCCEPSLTAGAAHGPARDPRPRPVENRSSPPITGSVRWPWERSRLQGFAPRESPPLRRRWFRPTRGA